MGNSILVVVEVDLQFIYLLLEHASQNIVYLKQDDEGSEVHGLINDGLDIILRGREYREDDGKESQNGNTDAKHWLDEYSATVGHRVHCSGHPASKINQDLDGISVSNEPNDDSEANSQQRVLEIADDQDTRAWPEIAKDL